MKKVIGKAVSDTKRTTEAPAAALEKKAGAGPALAAHSKDAKSKGSSGQSRKAAAKKT